jgi:hypothetical protein
VSYLVKLRHILTLIEDLMEDATFFDQLTGEDQGFLDTIWDYFDRVEAELNPDQVEADEEDPMLWQRQQDAETE